MNTKELTKAKSKVAQLLLDESLKKHPIVKGKKRSVSIEIWEDKRPGIGLRVAEVSFVDRPTNGQLSGTQGSSFMQCDEESVCFLCERLIIELAYQNEPDDATDLTNRLFHAAFI